MSKIRGGSDEVTAEDWFKQNIDKLEREAQSDAPHAWVAQSILDNIDDD